jgi:phage replication-related protein YjqB (UPF0714/DUF867 family)
LSLHIFRSRRPIKTYNLHITSHRYDQHDALALAANCRIGIGIHGRKAAKDGDHEIWMGGLNIAVRDAVGAALIKAGFYVKLEGHRFAATNPLNICNRTAEHGIQLELPPELRDRLCDDVDAMNRFTTAVRFGLTI